MKSKLLVIALGGALLLGVAALITLMDLQTGGQPLRYLPTGTSPADLPEPASPEAKLVARHCQACHTVPLPSMHWAEDWPEAVVDMRDRMISRVMAPLPIPSPAEERAMIAYFQRHAPRKEEEVQGAAQGQQAQGAAQREEAQGAPLEQQAQGSAQEEPAEDR